MTIHPASRRPDMALTTILVPQARSWSRADDPPHLPAGDVHLWQARLDGPLGFFASVELPAVDRARAQRFASETHGARFLTSRRLLRGILGRYVGRRPEELAFERTQQGKPFLSRGDVRFNLAHTNDRFLLGVARDREIGVDLECIDRRVDFLRIARRILADEEISGLSSLMGDARARGFFRAWAAHEALVKMMGTGMFASSRSFAVEPDPARPLAVRTSLPIAGAVGEVPLDDSHAGAFAADGSNAPRIHHWSLSRAGDT